MNQRLSSLVKKLHKRAGLSLLIVVAAILIEAISLLQYNYARDILNEQVEQNSLHLLITKALVIKGTLNQNEIALSHHLWDFNRNINTPDSLYNATERLLLSSSNVLGCAVAFSPYYYPAHGKLFEPYSYRDGDEIRHIQLSSDTHDYTSMDFYRKAFDGDSAFWSDPYHDDLLKEDITTYSLPVRDDNNELIGVCGMDLSLRWLGDTLNARSSHPSSFCLLLTGDGNLISGPDVSHARFADMDRAVTMINDSTVTRQVGASGRVKVVDFTGNDGRKGYIYHSFMRGNPHWQLALVCYDDEVYGELYRMRRVVLLLMLAGFALLGYILYRFMASNRSLHEESLARERINSELRVAHEIQSDMLPRVADKRDELDLAGMLIPAKEVGGDLYDYLLRDEKLFFCIGDVSGKGVPSALVMAVTHSLFRSTVTRESHPARIMQAINDVSCRHNDSGMFVTFFIGVLDLPTGRLHYCNAGHDAPILFNGNDVHTLDVTANIPLGVITDFKYESGELTMSRGTTLLLYTDGVTEAKDTAHRQYTLTRLITTVADAVDCSPENLLHHITSSVNHFVGNAPQSDDITLMAVRYNGHQRHYSIERTLTITDNLNELSRLHAMIEEVCRESGIEAGIEGQLRLALEEIVVNVINYAYAEGEKGEIEVYAGVSEGLITWRVTDSGAAFAPTDVPEADITLGVEDRAIGGLGIHLVRQLTDTLNYERIDGHNVTTIEKKL